MELYSHICKELGVTKTQASRFALAAPKKYKIYSIPKRTSGKRIIAHPSRRLKAYQRILVSHLQSILPVHKVAVAYKNGLGIKDNARRHSKGRYLLKMDFQKFFPSITPEILFSYLDLLGVSYNEEDRFLLTQLLFCNISKTDGAKLRLSIGAPSSPFISNTIMYFFDEAMFSQCKSAGVVYTRYADDLTFSTNVKGQLFEVPKLVSNQLKHHFGTKILINHAKTIFSSKAHNRHVTGITLTNDGRISVGRERKRLVSSMIHNYSLGKLDKDDLAYLRGLFSFVCDIEPDYMTRMINKYSSDVISAIIRGSNEKEQHN